MDLPQRYLDILADRGINLQAVFGTNDIALDRTSTLQAIEILEQEGALILGGDAYLMSNGKLRFALANWFTKGFPDESLEGLAHRAVTKSRSFVAQFEDSSGDLPYFSLVVRQD